MTALFIMLGVIAFLLILLWIPVFVRVKFVDTLTVRVRVLFVPFTLYPQKRKTPEQIRKAEEKQRRKEQKNAKKQLKKQRKKQKQPQAGKPRKTMSQWEQLLQEDGISGLIEYCAEIAVLLGKAFKRILRSVTVDKLWMQVLVGSDDASQTALDYGRVCSAVYPTLALVESAVRVRRQKVVITPDFLREKSRVTVDVSLHIIPLGILWAVIMFFMGYLGNTMAMKTAAKKEASPQSNSGKGDHEKVLTEKR